MTHATHPASATEKELPIPPETVTAGLELFELHKHECVQDLAPGSINRSVTSDQCNFECSYCGLRWIGRRILSDQED